MSIDHFGDQPVYLQLVTLLRNMIESGEIAPRHPLPSINTLVQQYEISTGTVEKALGVLKAEGLIRTVPGRGMYVTPREG